MMSEKETSNRGPLLDHLDALEEKCKSGDVNFHGLIEVFGREGHFVFILFLILPFLQPIPLFGLSTPFGILIAIVAWLAYFDKPIWIPQAWANKRISAVTVLKIAEGSEKIFEKIHFLLRPRWNALFLHFFSILNVFLIILNAALLALPLPIPFSNTLPAIVILFQALAHLEKDGLFIVLSYVQTLICLGYFFYLSKGVGLGIEKLDLMRFF